MLWLLLSVSVRCRDRELPNHAFESDAPRSSRLNALGCGWAARPHGAAPVGRVAQLRRGRVLFVRSPRGFVLWLSSGVAFTGWIQGTEQTSPA